MSDTLRVSNLHFGLNTSNYNQPQMGFTSVGIGSTANYGFLQFYGTSNTLCWTANGTVGIGMTNPLYSLDVLGTTQLRCVIPSFGQPDSTVLPSISYTSLAQQWNVVSGLSTSINGSGCGLSSTGQYQTVFVGGSNGGNNIYYSSNYGATWSLATGFLANVNYYRGAVSGSGQYQLVGISNPSSALYVSSNYGQTWSATSYTIGASAYARNSCLSNNGQYQFNVQAGSGTGRIAVSSNYGATFANSSAPAGEWHGVCCSSTGQYVSACGAVGYIWYSTNYGSTWTQSLSISASWIAMCCSASGQYQMAVINGTGSIYYSSDYGVNWTLSNAPALSWGFISCTSTGQYVIATSGSYMYYSTNYGVTWLSSTSIFANWQACAISQNGVYALACVSNGAVYSSLLSNVALAANGTVGIGITNPQYSLDVLGTAQLRGSFGQPDVNPLPSNAYTSLAQQWNIVSGLSSSVNWYGCAVSATGQYQTALINGAISGNNIYYSSNYGATWSLATGFLANAAYIWMGMSGTGQYQLTSINAGSTALYVSSNYGQTWSATSYTISASAVGRSSCISYNGQYQFNVQGGGSIAVSSNYGASFANAAVSTGSWNGVCCSSSGQYVTACIYGGNISYSTNYGVAWTACTGLSNANWLQMCCSASGQYQMVTVGSGSIWYSSNYGVNWTVSNAPTSSGWQSISCTSSGQYVIAPISSGKFYYSTNYGVTWTILSSSPSVAWQACAISQNGIYALACVNGGAVYSSVLSGAAMVANGNVGIGTTAPVAPLHIYEANGTVPTNSAGSIILSHGNTGSQSIVFQSKSNIGSDYGYIQFIDTVTATGYSQFNYFGELAADTEAAALVIGCENDKNATVGPDCVILRAGSIVLDPTTLLNAAGVTYIKGNVGIGKTDPSSALHVNGNAVMNTLQINGGSAFQIARGKNGSGVVSGTVTFPFTFTNVPSITCSIETASTTQLFSIHISSVSTTGFNFTKTWVQTSGAAGGGAGEAFFWIALG